MNKYIMPFIIRKIRNKDLYSVKNAITGQIHSHETTKANAKKQVKLLQAIDYGFIPKKQITGGLSVPITNPLNYPISVSKTLYYGRADQLNPHSRATLQKYGNIPIIDVTVFRYLIPKAVIDAVKLLFNGRPEPPLDRLAHLGLIFILENGKKIMFEKNETINITTKLFRFPKETEYLPISLNGQKNLTLDEIVEKTRAKMGPNFSKYTALHHNCQDLVINIMRENRLGNLKDQEFIKQDLKSLLKKVEDYPFLEKIVNYVTDLGYVVDVFKEGGKRRVKFIQ